MEKSEALNLAHTYFTLDRRLRQLALLFRQNPPSAELRSRLYSLYQDFEACRPSHQESQEALRQKLNALESELEAFYAILPKQYWQELSHEEFQRLWQEFMHKFVDNYTRGYFKSLTELCKSAFSQEIHKTPYHALLDRLRNIAVKLDQLPSMSGSSVFSEVRRDLDILMVQLEALIAQEEAITKQMLKECEQALFQP